MDFIKIILMIVICHLTLIELGIDRVWHLLRYDTEYKIPKSTIVMLWLYAACAVMFAIQAFLK